METLKPKNALADPDERNIYYVHSESNSEAKQFDLDGIYEEVESINLHQNVPDHIKSHFMQAKHLALYSWYHYPFNVTSQLMAFVSVEYALKNKDGSNKHISFKRLIEKAVKNKWVTDDGFSITKHRVSNGKSYVETLVENPICFFNSV